MAKGILRRRHELRPIVRLFVAVLLPRSLQRCLALAQGELHECGARVKWVEEVNLHLTLKFLGEVPVARQEQIVQALGLAVEKVPAFTLAWRGLGAFPTPRKPRVVWAGLERESPELVRLQRRVERRLAQLGFPEETRPYQGHVTLGRLRDPRETGQLPALLAGQAGRELGSSTVSGISLMQSILTPGGPLYREVAAFPLEGRGEEVENCAK